MTKTFLPAREAVEAIKDGATDIGVLKFGNFEKESIDPESRKVRFVFSDGEVDRENDKINPKGWKLDDFRRNPAILWSHDHRNLPIGRATEIAVSDGKLIGTVEFADHPFAETVFRLVRGGFLNATSVGFQPEEWSIDEKRGGVNFESQSLLETSIVPVPANPRALIAASAEGIDLEPVREWIGKTIAEWPEPFALPTEAKGNLAEASEPEIEADSADEGGSEEPLDLVAELPVQPVEAHGPVRIVRQVGDVMMTYEGNTTAEIKELVAIDSDEVAGNGEPVDEEPVLRIADTTFNETEVNEALAGLESVIRGAALAQHTRAAIRYRRGAPQEN